MAESTAKQAVDQMGRRMEELDSRMREAVRSSKDAQAASQTAQWEVKSIVAEEVRWQLRNSQAEEKGQVKTLRPNVPGKEAMGQMNPKNVMPMHDLRTMVYDPNASKKVSLAGAGAGIMREAPRLESARASTKSCQERRADGLSAMDQDCGPLKR